MAPDGWPTGRPSHWCSEGRPPVRVELRPWCEEGRRAPCAARTLPGSGWPGPWEDHFPLQTGGFPLPCDFVGILCHLHFLELTWKWKTSCCSGKWSSKGPCHPRNHVSSRECEQSLSHNLKTLDIASKFPPTPRRIKFLYHPPRLVPSHPESSRPLRFRRSV